MLGAVAFYLFACVTANLAIDPYGVFGTNLWSSHISTNLRHWTYARYLRERPAIDTIVLGSSRVGLAFDPGTVESVLPGRRVAQLWNAAGTVSDALPFVRAVMRDRDQGLNRVDVVILVLDLQLLGTNHLAAGRFTQHHPAVGGEPPITYYIGHLFHLDYNQMIRKIRHSRSIGRRDLNLFRETLPLGSPFVVDAAPPTTTEDVLARAETGRQLGELRQLVAITRARGVRLEVIVPPMSPNERRLIAPSFEPAVACLRGIAPVWLFETPDWLARDPAQWLDAVHYAPGIATAMLSRVFATDRPPAPPGFGVHLPLLTGRC